MPSGTLLAVRGSVYNRAESRNAQRALLSCGVRFWRWNEASVAAGAEISASGIFVRTAALADEGSHVTLRIELPGTAGITVLGRVVRTVKGGPFASAGMGIRFLDLGPTQRQNIERFVEGRARMHSESS